MNLLRSRAIAWAFVAAAVGVDSVARASAGRLGGGEPPDVSIARIVSALVICVIIAILAALLIRQRGGRIAARRLLGGVEFGSRAIKVMETRRLSQHADACLIRYDGREYLLLLQAGNAQVLSGKPLPTPLEIEPIQSCD